MNKYIILILVMMSGSVCHGNLYFEQTYSTLNGTLDGTGFWFATGVTFTRKVWQDNLGDPYHYFGNLSILGEKGEISHLIEQVSANAGERNLLCFNVLSGTVGSLEWGYFKNAPWDGSLKGFKLDNAGDFNLKYEYTSTQAPIWGNWSAADGKAGGEGLNLVYNTGFGSEPPTFPIWGNEACTDFIPVQDTTGCAVPAPGAFLLCAFGLSLVSAKLKQI